MTKARKLQLGCLAVILLLTFCARHFIKTVWDMARTGKPMAVVEANELAEDINEKMKFNQLQEWATGLLQRYNTHKLATLGKSEYWSEGSIKVAPKEVPESLRSFGTVSIRVRPLGQCVVISRYFDGVFVGPKTFVTDVNPYYLHEIQPGIYVYARGK